MRRRRVRAVAAATLLIAFGTGGCLKKRQESVHEGPAAPPPVDVTADRALARKSWIVEVARDPAPLEALASSNPGWGKLFEGDPAAALAAFEPALASAPPDSPVRVGAARAALELADAQQAIADLTASLLPDYLKVVQGQPDAAKNPDLTAWAHFVLGRQAQATGADPASQWKAIDGAVAAAAWRQAATGQGDPAVVGLLAGKAEGADATPPPGGTPSFAKRLQLRSLVTAGRLDEARRVLSKIDPKEADIVVGEGDHAVGLRDAIAAGGQARAYAAVAADVLKATTGWPTLFRARAELLVGRPADAARTLEALLKAPPERATLAELVLTGALGVDELKAEAQALRVRALAESGQADAARVLLATMPHDTIAQRVERCWAATFVGEKADADAFPEDRTVLSRALGEELSALGAAAKGSADVQALALVDRYVDEVQRLFADALVRSGQEALGLKEREDAEDKASSFSPSARNRLPALVRAARDSARVGRPRVALKYLSRLDARLPEVAGPADMLRDLLTVRAMEEGSTAAAGQ
jgi:hypothetical protein